MFVDDLLWFANSFLTHICFRFVYFRGKEPSSPEYHERLLRLAKQLELKLYRSAPSFEAYLDKFTKSGLQHLAVRVAMESWPSGPQLVRAALQSTERNQLQCKFEHKVAALQKEVDRVTNEKSHVDAQLKEAVDQLKAKESSALELKTLIEEVQVVKSEKMLLIEQMNTISTSNESLESERNRVQQQLDSLVRIDRNKDMEQQRNIIELNERIISLQQAHDDALSSLKHKHEVVLSEKRSLEQTILNMRSMSNEGRGSSRSSITQKALLLFQAGVSILTDKTTASGFDMDTSETDTTILSRIYGTRSEQLPIAALSSIRGSMVNEVEYNAGTGMKGGRKRTHMNSVSDGSNKSNKSPRL
jgi:alpha-glucosidase (family GH31 glycosyl hydrolase)